jgi:hypothetical protein
MSSSYIQARVKAGLAKAAEATGSPQSVGIFRVVRTETGTPIAPASTEVLTLLPDAIFKSYDKGLIDVSIQTGDRQLVSNSDNVITVNDTIRQGTSNYMVVAVDDKSPRGEALVYISQLRQQ